MNRIITKISILLGLSSLLIACGGGGNEGIPISEPDQSEVANVNPPTPDLPSEDETESKNKQNADKDNEADDEKNSKEINPKEDIPEATVTPQTTPRKPKDRNLAFLGESNDYFLVSCASPSDLCNTSDVKEKQLNVYTLTTRTDEKNQDKTTEHFQTIELKTANMSGEGYKFTLLDNKQAYYGYRQRAQVDGLGRHYQFIYGADSDVIQNASLPNDYTASYQGEFLYSPYSLSDKAGNNQVKSGEATLDYKDGNVTGGVYNKNNSAEKHKLFAITGHGRNFVIESTKDISHSGTNISPNQRAGMEAIFVSSNKERKDHKYLFGAVKATPSEGNNVKYVGFAGVLYAEKQEK